MNCPYCRKYFAKKSLAIDHINKKHTDKLDIDGMDAAQALYFSEHGTLSGKCMCGCGKPTEWNYKTGKPYKVSNDPECRARLTAIARANKKKVYGTDNLLTDMERQREMAKHRHISGEYTFKDGGKVSYVGSLELNWLQFCDNVMDFSSNMVQEPLESFKYYDPLTDKERYYLPDYYLPDYNLIVEIKDGGDKTNTNPAFIKETKYKVKLKDDVMRTQTKYNYIKITGANYGPFLEALYQIVHKEGPEAKTRNAVVVITESACVPMEDKIDWAQQEELPKCGIYLMIGYISGTTLPLYVGLSDSTHLFNWLVYDMRSGRSYFTDRDDDIFRNTDYTLYRCTSNTEGLQTAWNTICQYVEADRNDIELLKYLFDIGGVGVDDGKGGSNNKFRKMDFIKIESYTAGKECEAE